MNNILQSSVGRRRSLFIWALFCILGGVTFLAYALTSMANGRGEVVMPLDDVYIHFQYARQLAVGQPYVYNPGLPATSGATSFLYPYVLAIGYLIGFQGLKLGLWAMGVGAVALACSMWQVYKLVRRFGAHEWLAVLVAVAFGVNGSVAWHFMSGMETGLMMLLTLGTLRVVIARVQDDEEQRRRPENALIIWATALALMRPEGGLLAVVAVAVVWWNGRESGKQSKGIRGVVWDRVGLLIPLAAIGVQPLVNLLFTGSAVASGNAAKSVLGEVPFYWDDVIRRIFENFVWMWVEFGTGSSPREGLYIMPLLLVLVVIGIGWLASNQKRRSVSFMLVLWLVGGTLMLATLDTVFWHFKRYQMPFIGLLFPVAGWGIAVVAGLIRKEDLASRQRGWRGVIGYVTVGGMLVVAAMTSAQFLRYYSLNVGYVYAQPLQMARWLQANTPTDAVIAVHDVGMMRYMGGRTTLDMVGLTTKGAADYWRNGPGAVAEFLMQEKPDYIASYGHGHGYGLGMIADTDIYGQPLASFPVDIDNSANVALAADFQGIYKPDWTADTYTDKALQFGGENYGFDRQLPAGSVNVGNIASEKQANYSWHNAERLSGFPTEVHEFNYISCATGNCLTVDGGRLINGEESFDMPTGFDSAKTHDLALVTRLHPEDAGTIDVYANGELVGSRWIPAMQGNWLEVVTCIPAAVVSKTSTPDTVHIRIVPHVSGGFYMPYYHWIYGCPQAEPAPKEPVSTFQDGAIELGSAKLDYQPDKATLGLNLEWYTDGSAKGDYKVFVHLYADPSKPPVAQLDMRPGKGTLPPGNWLPGVLRDTITVDLTGVPSGKYQVAIGMYDPVTFERLQPSGGDEQSRLFIGEVDIQG